MPMQTFVAGAEMMSTGTWRSPTPPNMQSGTSDRLTIMAPAPLRHEHRERNDGPDSFVIFESGLQAPHLLVSVLRVQRAAIRRRDDQRERVRAAVAIHVFQPVAELLMRFEVLQQVGIGVQARKAQSEAEAHHDHAR